MPIPPLGCPFCFFLSFLNAPPRAHLGWGARAWCGDSFHIVLAAGAGGQDTLKAAFLSGLDVRGFALKEPTLHDAFIGLTGDNPDQPAVRAEAVQ